MKSDPLQGIIIVKGSAASLRAVPAGYRKIRVISDSADYTSSNSRISSANLIKILNKLRSFS